MPTIRQLNEAEIRVLGALLEKQQTTPEAYPLTLNALIAACNQKSNREPVTELGEETVQDAVDRLRHDALVWRTEGARTVRYEQMADRRFSLDGAAKAVMTLLFLRGPQTPGELRTRSERLHAFGAVDEVEAVLARLAARDEPLVRELPRRPGQRESRWLQLAGANAAGIGPEAAAPASARAWTADETPSRTERSSAGAAGPGPRLTDPGLAERMARLETQVATLSEELRALKVALGVEPGS